MNEYFLREMVLMHAKQREMSQYNRTKELEMQEADPNNQQGIDMFAEISKVHLCMAEGLLNLISSYAAEHSKWSKF